MSLCLCHSPSRVHVLYVGLFKRDVRGVDTKWLSAGGYFAGGLVGTTLVPERVEGGGV
ncbi:MAG: hypothetical protein GFH27_549313n64 [Chloroflexi bacterium AL-W]|nr:hypothetical protein [Chloroflexi bacterium AL-N1]NOK69487.1 hypothetical protein [Chloroflexi bacterium AL-N10]NOK77452.1 hypothetical protein [Chloroflexi bacterium AL-N5]NOK84303.1 hypothetical protein [Chloroflexi bacterium AL-W]NOK91531.1 hypothetical protein [Chloroflexi bacterium AL-N15]